MGRKKLKPPDKKERLVLFVKSKHLKKVKQLVIKTIEDHERSGNSKEDKRNA